MKQTQGGFTLIELVVVIVLLGILGVTALGRFQDLSGDAAAAALSGVASELSASSAINFAEGTLDATYTIDLTAANICTSGILGTLLQSGTFPSDITVTGTGNCSTAGAGETVSCTLEHSSDAGNTITASIVCGG